MRYEPNLGQTYMKSNLYESLGKSLVTGASVRNDNAIILFFAIDLVERVSELLIW